MAGIEKMTDTILADAMQEADAILAAARKEAQEEKDKANEVILSAKGKKKDLLDKELEEYRLRAESARDLLRRRMILEKKQEIIGRIIEKTRLSLHEAEAGTYFNNLYKLFEKHCRAENGKMRLNSRDLERLPGDFAERCGGIAKAKGGSIELVKEPVSIEDGFIVEYESTVENCTLRTLIEADKEILFDEINKMLWRDANG